MTQRQSDSAPAMPALESSGKLEVQDPLQSLSAENERLTAAIATMGGVSHDLNNRLTGILGFSQLLQDCQTTDTARKYVTMLEDEARRFGEIVGSLSYFARPAGPDKIRIHLADILERTLKLHGDSLRRNKITVDLVHEPNLPEVLAEPQRLMQVFLSLIVNVEQAIRDARSPGTMQIRIGRNADYVQVSFSCRLSKSALNLKLNLPTGFEIYKSIIEGQRGKFELKNTAADASEFVITLPAAPPP